MLALGRQAFRIKSTGSQRATSNQAKSTAGRRSSGSSCSSTADAAAATCSSCCTDSYIAAHESTKYCITVLSYSLFTVYVSFFFYIFLFIPCCRLSWLFVSFFLHVKTQYRIVWYCHCACACECVHFSMSVWSVHLIWFTMRFSTVDCFFPIILVFILDDVDVVEVKN